MQPITERLGEAVHVKLGSKTAEELAEFRRLQKMVSEKEAKGLVVKQPYSAPGIDELERHYSLNCATGALLSHPPQCRS